ncbi:MAG: hypothetical protein JJU05_14740 [Verrucomicrobia bacterium]|nr:hypothetical protein [Verrucomicrobiota bacterium]MCH8528036.1 hypothetical protein [Kiritimatiellia bacterium]
MSTSKPRIKRGTAPKSIKRHNYRKKALPALRRDFKDRCAYSDLHVDDAGGIDAMDVDHFNPTLKKEVNQRYSNLFLSTRHCNGSKGEFWPSEKDRKSGLRLLNPCRENEFPDHIVEEAGTGRLIGKTPAGKLHILVMGLNDPSLVQHRIKRRHFRDLLHKSDGLIQLKREVSLSDCGEAIRMLKENIDKMIMDIPLEQT